VVLSWLACALGPAAYDRLRVWGALRIAFGDCFEPVELSDPQWELFVEKLIEIHEDAHADFQKAVELRGHKAKWDESHWRALDTWNILIRVWGERGDADAALYVLQHVEGPNTLPEELDTYERFRAGLGKGSYGYLWYERKPSGEPDRSRMWLGMGENED